MNLRDQAKFPHQIDYSEHYLPCKGEECERYLSEWNRHHHVETVCCLEWQAGYCLKTAKNPLVSMEGVREWLQQFRSNCEEGSAAWRFVDAMLEDWKNE